MIGAKGLPGLRPVGGGIEAHVERLGWHLAGRGHEVTVYVRKYANPLKKKTWKGLKLVTLPSWNRKNLDTITHVFLASWHAIAQDYDIIHYHGIGPATLAWIPRLFSRPSRVIVTFHSRDQFHEKWGLLAKAYLAFAEWASVKLPHATIAVSHSIQLLCSMLFRSRQTYYIPNGVEMARKNPGSDELKRFGLKKGRYFLHLARLVPHKAQDDSIKAFLELDTQDKLVIAGSAAFDDAKYLEDLKRMSKKDKRIVFTGHQSGEILKQLIANCRAMVHPSRSEGLSIAILEAMSYGKLVIMSDIQPNLELIDHSGIAIPVGDVRALSTAMGWALENPDLVKQRGERAKEIVHRLYSWESVTRRVEKVYNQQLQPEIYEDV